MAYNIVYKKSVHRDLWKLAKAEAARILSQIEEDLLKSPESNAVLKGAFAGLRKFQVGDYRIIYAILGDDILILRIAHRRDVYRSEI